MSIQELKTLELERSGGILHVRLNRPERRNAFNGVVVSELASTFKAASKDKGLRVIVLSGKGKSFSAGADLNWMKEQAELPPAENAAGAEEMARMFLAIARCKKPVVARIHGHALGGGSGLSAAVDIAICAEDTLFGLTEVKLGIIPAVISPFVLQKIGASKARALFLTGERFDGREAERIGLVHRALPEANLDQEVDRVVSELHGAGPEAIAQAKVLIQDVGHLSLEDAIPITSRRIAELRATPEAKEGMSAFLDKRKPQWLE
ncbi:MAG: enoyl-CoA hydratase-related protein [Planctomycetota bacterium]|jgi:methylglutaconyl-CoA hydratase